MTTTIIGLGEVHPTLSADGSTIIFTDGINVKVSQDWGATWISKIVGAVPNISVLARRNTLYLSKRNGVLSSVDNGVNWTSVPTLEYDITLGNVDENLFENRHF